MESKGINTSSQETFLRKRDYHRFRGVVYRWIELYLQDKQYVSVSKPCPGDIDDKMGSQGSSIGPFFFLIYIDEKEMHTVLHR